jgi:hypothetical protein
MSDPTQHAILSARIAAALADLDRVLPNRLLAQPPHHGECWRWHLDCLAARIRRTLTEGDNDHG